MTKELMGTIHGVLSKLEIAVHQNPSEKIKSIINTYFHLLRELNVNHEDFKDEELKYVLVEHKDRIINLAESMNNTDSVRKLISEDKFSELNYLLSTTDKLKSIKSKIERILEDIYSKYNQKVLIVSNSTKAMEKLNELIDKNKEEVWYTASSLHNTEMKTDKNNYLAYSRFSEGFRGRRMDKVYIDSSMSDNEIEIAKSFVNKSNGDFEFF